MSEIPSSSEEELKEQLTKERSELIKSTPDPKFNIGDVVVAKNNNMISQFILKRAYIRDSKWVFIWYNGEGLYTSGSYDFNILKKLK